MAPAAVASRPPKPSKIRYFKGKAPDAAALSDESSDEEAEEQQDVRPQKRGKMPKVEKDVVAGGAGRVFVPGQAAKMGGAGMKVELGGVKVGGMKPQAEEESEEEESEEDEEDEEEAKSRVGLPKPAGSDGSSEYETDSEEESEEEPPKPAFRPVFIAKKDRNMTADKLKEQEEERLRLEEEMEEKRKMDSKEMAGETIRRELAEKEASDLHPDIDDTDGLDPSAEFDAWRARELARLLRDKQAQTARDEEREEIERRRAMPEEQRLKEDMEHAEQTRQKEKGQMGFLQKYYHKGAFHQDDDLLARDYTGATESAVDMSMLPKVMQVRDFGKMSRTKYTHLADQDTSGGGWGTAARGPPGQQAGQFQTGCWNCGGPHLRKDCPNNDITNPVAGLGGGGVPPAGLGSSSNASALGGGGSYGKGWGGREEREERGGTYRQDGRERRFDEERRRDERESGRSGEMERYDDRHRERDRDRYDDRDRERSRYYDDGGREREKRRDRSRSRSPGRRDGGRDRDRERRDDRRRDDRDRDRDRR